ncbi:hypothetical protein ACIJDI_002802 [Enterococcus faecalis]|uniref:hypothetical protein n=1 Tax=Enterococcus faecalis TaxID=1351 RepID=UPI000CF2E4B0|nr:hypothetical protein [Enterococcus faecalis]EGO5141058.1 hypothetical protein [Enterococcus faecalis]EGO8006103.1 hypothetical protein [Enterococcus faecalis]EGO8301352.1 hypothetical protein [Enterococcus faecalis]EGO8435478.1 hypothetical protein [Enterococcus faecalis]EGO8834022.1 hypothetical protein [Enterococcus faecalis]
MTGTHLNKPGTQQKKRIYFEVSEEAAKMWEEIVSHEKKKAAKNKRYYPAHTMEKLIRDRHDLLKAFGD